MATHYTHPGLYIQDIIRSKTPHRARAIFYDTIEDRQLLCRRCDSRLLHYMPVLDRVMPYIRLAGFEGVLLCGSIRIDHALVTALVERWRPETHTFHLPVGEATITLQDVEVLWELPIDGEPVIGVDDLCSIDQWTYLCQELLGITLAASDFVGVRLRIRCLETALQRHLPDDASEEECRQRARVYIMMLLGGHLLLDKSGALVQLRLLPFLGDIEFADRYRWGGAVLATLYRSICDATSPMAREITDACFSCGHGSDCPLSAQIVYCLLQIIVDLMDLGGMSGLIMEGFLRMSCRCMEISLTACDQKSLFGYHTLTMFFRHSHVIVLPITTYGNQ